MTRSWRTSLLLAGLAAGCATYRPAPVASDGLLARYDARTLDDPALTAWFDTLHVPPPAAAWSPRALAIAATWLRSDRLVRGAEIRAADAAVLTAGGRPAPGISTDIEYAFTDPQADSRWGLAVAAALTVELGGKRGARIGRAQAAALAARAAAREAEWQQVGEVYRAVLAVAARDAEAGSLARERYLQDSIVALVRGRYESAVATRTELARIEGESRLALAEEQRAAREAAGARASLRAAVGLPSASGELRLAEVDWPRCTATTTDRAALQRSALLRQWRVRRAAADYQVAEGELRVEVANASPDLSLGPGLFFDQGTGKFTLGAGLPSLLLNRNRGPIAEAEARRTLAGARLEQAQETVLTALDQALTACDRAAQEAVALDSLVTESARRGTLVESAWARGEIGRLEVLLARLETMRAERIALAARLRDEEARLALDLAAGAWGLEADGAWPGEGNR